MTSRKRNKGKERKARAAKLEAEKERESRALVRNTWILWARGMNINGQSIEIEWCNHGISLVIPNEDDHLVANFMDAWVTYRVNPNNVHVGQYLRETFTTYQEVWDNERYREMAVNIFTAIGTNSLLSIERGLGGHESKCLATAIVILENYNGSGDFDSVIRSVLSNRAAATKMRDISGGGSSTSRRDMLKFFRKRITCSCLKKIHLEARKTLPKVGMCYHCGEEKERRLLMVCGKCKISQYCSRECQMAHWPSHKRRCDMHVSEPQQAKMLNNYMKSKNPYYHAELANSTAAYSM